MAIRWLSLGKQNGQCLAQQLDSGTIICVTDDDIKTLIATGDLPASYDLAKTASAKQAYETWVANGSKPAAPETTVPAPQAPLGAE